MNRERGQREEAATSFLVLYQNFTKALKERRKNREKSKKRKKRPID